MLDFLYYVIEGIGWTLAPKPPGIFALDLLRQRPAWAGVGCPQAGHTCRLQRLHRRSSAMEMSGRSNRLLMVNAPNARFGARTDEGVCSTSDSSQCRTVDQVVVLPDGGDAKD